MLSLVNVQMYVTAPDTDTYAIPKVIGEMPKKVRENFMNPFQGLRSIQFFVGVCTI